MYKQAKGLAEVHKLRLRIVLNMFYRTNVQHSSSQFPQFLLNLDSKKYYINKIAVQARCLAQKI